MPFLFMIVRFDDTYRVLMKWLQNKILISKKRVTSAAEVNCYRREDDTEDVTKMSSSPADSSRLRSLITTNCCQVSTSIQIIVKDMLQSAKYISVLLPRNKPLLYCTQQNSQWPWCRNSGSYKTAFSAIWVGCKMFLL